MIATYQFLSELRDNNRREWFAEHKAQYDMLRSRWLDQLQHLIDLMSLQNILQRRDWQRRQEMHQGLLLCSLRAGQLGHLCRIVVSNTRRAATHTLAHRCRRQRAAGNYHQPRFCLALQLHPIPIAKEGACRFLTRPSSHQPAASQGLHLQPSLPRQLFRRRQLD